jgi:outer membrane protein TolC
MFRHVNLGLGQSVAGRRWLVSAAALAILLVSAGWAPEIAAQEQPIRWTLEELVGVALDQNPGLAAARTSASAAEEDVAAAKGEQWPKLDAVGLGEYFPRRERLLVFRHGFRQDDNPFQDAIVNYGLEVRLPLYTSGRIEHGISLAEARTEAARSRAELNRNELIFNVASGYYTGLRLQQVVAAQEAALSSLQESLRIAGLQREVGRIASLDLLRIETRESQVERDLAGARSAYAQTLELLKELINVPIEVSLDISGVLTQASAKIVTEAMRGQALIQRPDLIALRHQVQAQKAALGIAGSRLGLQVDLKASYRGVTGVDDGTTKDDAMLFVELRIPLYEGGVLRARKRKALIQLRETEQRLQAAERGALGDLERAVLDLKASEPRIQAARRAVRLAEESLRVERVKFTQGRGTSNDLLLAEEALLRARTELAVALADSQIAQAALKFATGEDPVSVAGGAAPTGTGNN